MRYIVCTALQNDDGQLIVGPRHFDAIMRVQIESSDESDWALAKQGFIDQHGQFMTREEAWDLAVTSGQIRRELNTPVGRLYSEHLY